MAENEPNSGLGPEGREEGLTPWEQHAAVINIPRFDYNAPSSLLEYSHSGFLITCPIKREKSATKEAISILEKFIVSQSCGSSSECLEVLDANVAAKRRKVCIEERNGKGGNNLESTKDGDTIRDSDGISKETSSFSAKIGVEFSQVLSLVKLTRSGLLLLTIPRNSSYNTVDILSNIFCSLDSRSLKAPLWIHRILPIQATCSLNEMDLRRVVSKLVQQFLDDKQNNVERPVKDLESKKMIESGCEVNDVHLLDEIPRHQGHHVSNNSSSGSESVNQIMLCLQLVIIEEG
uniref:THUMP domain-containing protein n=1 Tax=Nelumbo nucifera TaxID=4432 RepID=A0A822YNU8_NELNU|nr:TPA_asm: hypothetical protein HUJ06_011377 [Nelumbo nucifera]